MSVNLSPDAPTVVNANGAKQSENGVRCDLFPARALLHISAILKRGAEKYGENNWYGLSVEECLNHSIAHAYGFLANIAEDDDIGHFACRAVMALELKLRKEANAQ